jgi:hypothetical protein
VAATGEKRGEFDTVTARKIFVKNGAGEIVVGLVVTKSAKGKMLVLMTSTVDGEGTITTYQPDGKELVDLTTNDNGGLIYVYNKTGEGIANMGPTNTATAWSMLAIAKAKGER